MQAKNYKGCTDPIIAAWRIFLIYLSDPKEIGAMR
jgi:hypothetical protein